MQISELMSWRAGVAALSMAVVALGCGSRPPGVQVGKVRGTVTFQGKPVQSANVTFEDRAQGQLASAELQSDGTYTVTTGEGGLRVGSYHVWLVPVSAQAPSIADLGAASAPNPSDIPKKYRDSTTSGLTLSVQPGENRFDIELGK